MIASLEAKVSLVPSEKKTSITLSSEEVDEKIELISISDDKFKIYLNGKPHGTAEREMIWKGIVKELERKEIIGHE